MCRALPFRSGISVISNALSTMIVYFVLAFLFIFYCSCSSDNFFLLVVGARVICLGHFWDLNVHCCFLMYFELKLMSFQHFLICGFDLLIGIIERVADIKTRAQAMKCLSTFCEAVGPGFIFERVSPFSPRYVYYWWYWLHRGLSEWVELVWLAYLFFSVMGSCILLLLFFQVNCIVTTVLCSLDKMEDKLLLHSIFCSFSFLFPPIYSVAA